MTNYPNKAAHQLWRRYGVLGDLAKEEIATEHDGCRLCWALSDAGQRHPVNTIIHSTSHHALIPALGAMVPRYVMLVAREHCASAATLSQDGLRLLEQQLEDTITLLGQRFPASEWIAFEHGTTLQCGVKACCVDHLHLHLVPIALSLTAELGARLECEARPIASLSELGQLNGEGATNYIYVRDPDGRSCVFTPESYSSQLVRQIIAARVDRKDAWNWLHHPMEESSIQTLREFRRAGVSAPAIYFAHAIEGISKQQLPQTIQDARAAVARRLPGVRLLSMHELLEPILDGTDPTDAEVNHFLVATERQFVESSDLVIADLSRPGWQYIGSLMEIVYASLAGVPVVAITGSSNIGSRRWLNAHATLCVQSLEEAVEASTKILSSSR